MAVVEEEGSRSTEERTRTPLPTATMTATRATARRRRAREAKEGRKIPLFLRSFLLPQRSSRVHCLSPRRCVCRKLLGFGGALYTANYILVEFCTHLGSNITRLNLRTTSSVKICFLF